jgi:hypothetical protein
LKPFLQYQADCRTTFHRAYNALIKTLERDNEALAGGIDPEAETETVAEPGSQAAAEAPEAPAPEVEIASENEPTLTPEWVVEVVDNTEVTEHTGDCVYEGEPTCDPAPAEAEEEAGLDEPEPGPGTCPDLASQAPPPPRVSLLELRIRQLQAQAEAWDAELAASSPTVPQPMTAQESVRERAPRPPDPPRTPLEVLAAQHPDDPILARAARYGVEGIHRAPDPDPPRAARREPGALDPSGPRITRMGTDQTRAARCEPGAIDPDPP